ncbi:NAD(+) diphosphatase [Vibrio sagamiensis]|uniref:NAD-capped RNA hydrolase NudC n=1 Tax=Vibrio sagamiensis NBRC 104589 TaxID=1219064 RepID=A0A511QL61_9VIBR|nr:NAD(+) diphosphatase [Vibrio sagamiensis]PNQ69879.1 NAD(+) diphosphatase [Vibrio agarivorans]GEM77242.1 NADH pyrophosphatase [Vibrio sagamiensis NBRC 104589]
MLRKSEVNHVGKAYWCVVSGSEVWLINGHIPFGQAADFSLPDGCGHQIGHYQGEPVRWVNLSDLEGDLELTSLRDCLHFPEALFLLISKAAQYGHMTSSLRFCPQCGGRNFLNHTQLAMQCSECRTLHYPRIFPCIIVAVRKGKQILLAQHARHRNGMYTVIAGFLEVGETLEECVAREVYEETGIHINNIRYFASQPWAFPSSMMVGFLADYQAGEIKPDYAELADAKWFDITKLPAIAPQGTIARALIERTCKDIQSQIKYPGK